MAVTFNDLLEGTDLTEEVKTGLQEAWESKISEARDELTAELREEFAQRYSHDKSQIVEAMDNFISEKVEASPNRVALGDAGYLLEIDQLERLDADDVYFYTGSFLINIKEPELVLNSSEYNYAKDLLNNFEANLMSNQFNNSTTGYTSFIDTASFIDWYLISEITKNQDSRDFSSIFLNVIPGEKIKMGPLWDFDLAFGNVDYSDATNPTGFWVKDHKWYARLFQDPAFVNKVKSRFVYFKNNQNLILNKMDFYANYLKYAQEENDIKWNVLGNYVWPNPVVYNTYQEEVNHLKNWYTNRMNWLSTAYNSL